MKVFWPMWINLQRKLLLGVEEFEHVGMILGGFLISCMNPRWWQLKDVLCSSRKLGKMNPIWLIFFRMG